MMLGQDPCLGVGLVGVEAGVGARVADSRVGAEGDLFPR